MPDRSLSRSADQEHVPLLRDPTNDYDADADAEPTAPKVGVDERINAAPRERSPMPTPLTKFLLGLVLVLLLTSSVFIGLFSRVQHRLRTGNGRPTKTVTFTLTTAPTSTSSATTGYPSPIPEPTTTPKEEPCLTPSCVMLSASILSSLDTTQDPCENFYDFTNGGWLKAHPLPADKSSFGIFEALAKENKDIIKNIMVSTGVSISGDDELLLSKLRDFYNACLDEEEVDRVGAAPLVDVVNALHKLYRKTGTAAKCEDDKVQGLTAAVAFLHSKGIPALFTFDVKGDAGVDPKHLVVWFSPPELGLPSKEYFEEKSVRVVYAEVLERLLVSIAPAVDGRCDGGKMRMGIFSDKSFRAEQGDMHAWPPWPWPPWKEEDGGDINSVNRTLNARTLSQQVVAFERQLARASLNLDIIQQNPLATYNPVPLSNLTSTLTQIHFPSYFSALAPHTYPDRVIVTHPPYLVSLARILDATPPFVLHAYLVTRAALALAPYLGPSTEAWRAHRALSGALTGVGKEAGPSRAEFCVDAVESALGFAAGRFFVNETFGFGGEERGRAGKILSDIIASFKASLKHLEWMDAESADAAAEKADALRIKVGYPLSPDTRDPRSLVEYYNLVQTDRMGFFENVLSSLTSNTQKKWAQLGKQQDCEAWRIMVPSTADAYFDARMNEIVFPAGILRPPFLFPNWPGYLSYGAFGYVAAHELTHAFDSAGRMYNQEGKLQQWWTNATSQAFKVKQECIVNQYAAYCIEDERGEKVYVNGNFTSGENIGDSGLIQAHRAWKGQYRASKNNGNEYLLPGLNFTREQLFFISFGRIWARNLKPAAAVQHIRTDPHSPSRFRVDGTVRNMPEFAQAFKCSKKAKLNPPREDQCIFWS